MADAYASPPSEPRAEALVCPACGGEVSAFGAAGALPRCPIHDLALVTWRALEEADDDPLLGRTVAGRFTVLECIGVGSMGSVYRARQEAMGRDVALKIIRPDRSVDGDARPRFEREARAMSALSSPHVPVVYDFGEAEDGAWFMALELLHGDTLGARLRRRGPLPLPEAVRLMRQALHALGEAHGHGIVHRDLKPDNLFLVEPPGSQGGSAASEAPGQPTQPPTCKVLDFGIAKVARPDLRVDPLETQAGMVFGTPRYMSPEQAQGRPLDARSDLYSLGVIFYHAVAGRPPFTDDDAVVVMARHIRDPHPPLKEIAPTLPGVDRIDAVVARLLEKDPEDRPTNAQECDALLAALLPAEAGSGPHATSWVAPHPVGAARLWGRAWRSSGSALRVVAGGLGLVAVALAGAWVARPRPQAVTPTVAPPAASAAAVPPPRPEVPPEVVAAPVAGSGSAAAAPPPPAATAARPRSTARTAAPAAAPSPRRKPGDRYGRFE